MSALVARGDGALSRQSTLAPQRLGIEGAVGAVYGRRCIVVGRQRLCYDVGIPSCLNADGLRLNVARRQQVSVEELQSATNPSLQVVHGIVVAAGVVVEWPDIRTAVDAPRPFVSISRSTFLHQRSQRVHGVHDLLVRVVREAVLLPTLLHRADERLVLQHAIPVERHRTVVVRVVHVKLILPAVGAMTVVVVGVAPSDIEVPERGLPAWVGAIGLIAFLAVLVEMRREAIAIDVHRQLGG